MRLVFDPRNALEAHVVSHLLEQAGIQTSVSGSFLSSSRGETMGEDQTRVWVINDEDEGKARELIREWNENAPPDDTKRKNGSSAKYREHTLPKKTFLFFATGFTLAAFYMYAPFSIDPQDYNNDEKPDTSTHHEKGNLSLKKTIDRNNDGNPERTYHYDKNGNLRTLYYHDEPTGNIVKISDFDNGNLMSSRFDKDNDGTMDIKHTYDIYENISSETIIKK